MADDNRNAADQILGEDEKMAVLIVVLDGELGECPDQIPYDAPEGDIRTWATEAVAGGLPGIDPQEVDLTDFKVRRLPSKDGLPDRVMVRPKTEVGVDLEVKCKIPVFRGNTSDPEIQYIEVNTSPVRRDPEDPALVQVVIGDQSAVVEATNLTAAVANATNC